MLRASFLSLYFFISLSLSLITVDPQGGVRISPASGQVLTNSPVLVQGTNVLQEFNNLQTTSGFISQLFPALLGNLGIQLISTVQATSSVIFSIGSNYYLAIANEGSITPPVTGYCTIMLWNSTLEEFIFHQAIPQNNSRGVTYFTLNGQSYLALASNYVTGPSLLLKFDGTFFQIVQSWYQDQTFDFAFFSAGNDFFLVEAREFSPSIVRKWNNTAFIDVQTLNSGATDVEYFAIGSSQYVAVSYSVVTGGSTTVDIYSVNDTLAQPLQLVQTIQADVPISSKSFQIGVNTYLAIAEFGNVTNDRTSSIWKFNNLTNQFALYQTINSHGAYQWKHFQILGNDYLALANYRTQTSFSTSSQLYEWTGLLFSELANVDSTGATNWEFFNSSGVDYLFLCNSNTGQSYSTSSVLYRLTPY